MRAYGQEVRINPEVPDLETVVLRKMLIEEEVREFIEAEDLANMAKELADILYVVYGTAHAYGIDLDEVFKAVHYSNLSKLGLDGKPIYNEHGKVMKGPNYHEPPIHKVLGIEKGA